MGELGGFIIDDRRKVKSSSSISYLKSNKKEGMKTVISSAIKSFGFMFCAEHDQEEIPIDGVKSRRLDRKIHSGNMSKVVYYSDKHTVTELTSEQVKGLMTTVGKSIEEWYDYENRFSVIYVESTEGFFSEGYFIVCVHLKSVAMKEDFKKNKPEYDFIRSVIDSIEGNLIVMGDFNAPVYDEGKEHFSFTDEDRNTLPYHIITSEDAGFIHVSKYSSKDVASKIRSSNASTNPQAPLGGKKVGPRNYNTDHIFIRGKLTGFSTECKLYPLPEDKNNLVLPLLDGENDWVSDHQMVSGGVCAVWNVLSDDASDQNSLRDDFDAENRHSAERDLFTIMDRLVRYVCA